jgi:hypothetical protein
VQVQQGKTTMRDEQPPPFSVIFDPISKSALVNFGDRVTWLCGPFANYREALRAADRWCPPR